MKLQLRARDEKGAVLVIVAIFTLVLLTLSVGGIMMFSVYGANREMQKAADQAALAGAAALPLLRPGVALSSLNLNPVYNLTDNYGLDVPQGNQQRSGPPCGCMRIRHYGSGRHVRPVDREVWLPSRPLFGRVLHQRSVERRSGLTGSQLLEQSYFILSEQPNLAGQQPSDAAPWELAIQSSDQPVAHNPRTAKCERSG